MEPTPEPEAPPLGEQREKRAGAGRVLLVVAALVLVVSAAFSIGEVRGARRENRDLNPAAPNAPTAQQGVSGLSGLSVAGLQQLQSQVQHAAALTQGSSDAGSLSTDLSQLEQQLGIAPSSSTANQIDQLQAELNAINACLSSSATTMPTSC